MARRNLKKQVTIKIREIATFIFLQTLIMRECALCKKWLEALKFCANNALNSTLAF
jgi:hypothetical protein